VPGVHDDVGDVGGNGAIACGSAVVPTSVVPACPCGVHEARAVIALGDPHKPPPLVAKRSSRSGPGN